MSTDGIDINRRRFLTTTASVAGGAGAVATSLPFIATMTPSAKTRAIGAPVEVEIGDLQPGQLKIDQWQGKPVWIIRRSDSSLGTIAEQDDVVADCTHLGCSPTYVRREEADTHNLGSEWKGGFFCPCHGSRFDLAGRVYSGVPAPTNLVVPPHKYLSDTRVLIGEDSGETS